MRIIIECTSEQVFWTSVSEFEKLGHCIDLLRVRNKKGVFVIPVCDSGAEMFLEFVQENQKKEKNSNDDFYSKHFVITVHLDSVRGFVSQECLVEAIDLYNQSQMDYYVDPCIDVAEIKTDEGIVFVPEINDCRLECRFWDWAACYYVNNDIEHCIVIGNEVLND